MKFGSPKADLPVAIIGGVLVVSAVVAFVLGIYWLIWLLYENCVRAVFTSMPYASYWQFVGILFVISAVAGCFKSSRK